MARRTKTPRWSTADIPDQTGRTVVVTGANSGLGLATSRALAAAGAHVVLAVRDTSRGEAAAAGIPGSTEVRRLDLADCPVDGGRRGDVSGDGDGAPAGRLDSGDDLPKLIGAARQDRDRRPFRGEPHCDRPAETAPRARYERHLPCELRHAASPCPIVCRVVQPGLRPSLRPLIQG